MELSELPNILIFLVLLALSAFFSGTETAFFSLTEIEREKLKSMGREKAFRALMALIFSTPEKLLITILTGNMIVNIFASSLSETISKEIFQFKSDIYTIGGMTLILLVFGEMTPKNIAVRKSMNFAKFSGSILYYFYVILYPITFLLYEIKESFLSLFPVGIARDKQKKISLVKSAVSIGYNEGVINDYESRLLETFISMRNEIAADVMLPRNMIVGIDIETPMVEILAGFKKRGEDEKYSLYPVFRKDLDHIAGYVDVKDFIGFKLGFEREAQLHDLIRPVLPVPESKNIAELMKEMREKDTGMALIVDEYGGTAGIITSEHLIRKIFQYFYSRGEERIREYGRGTFLVRGNTPLEMFNEFFGLEVKGEGKTVAGLVLRIFDDIPEEGDRMDLDDLEIIVHRVKGHRIEEVIVRRKIKK